MLIIMSSRILIIKLSNFISIHLFWPETIPKYGNVFKKACIDIWIILPLFSLVQYGQ